MNKLLVAAGRSGLPISWAGWLIFLLATYDPLVNRHPDLWICLLPLTFFSVYVWVPVIQTDAALLTPKNFMLFVFFNKMVLIPVELLLVGNGIPLFDPHNSPLYEEITVTILSFITFMLGWAWQARKTALADGATVSLPPENRKNKLKWIYLLIGLSSLLIIYGSPITYLTQAILKNRNPEEGSLVGLLTNLGSRFLPFAVVIFWASGFAENAAPAKRIGRNVLFFIICLFSTLSSNRANIIYPLLSLVSVMASRFVVRQKLLVAVCSLPAIAILFFFGALRSQKSIDLADIPRLATLFAAGTDYLIRAHQVYFGSPYQITPLIGLDVSRYGSSLLSSLLYPVPSLGKGFRLNSGVILYNGAIYGNLNSIDQVIPVAGELYYNVGLIGVVLGHFVIGGGYQYIDSRFKCYRKINKAKAVAWFYISLLYNSLIFLSFSVFSQFIIYSALPALLLLF